MNQQNQQPEKAEWEPMRQRARARDVSSAVRKTCVNGTYALEVMFDGWSIPAGHIWFRYENGKRVAIAYIWVHEHLRRCGLATLLLNELIKVTTPLIITTATANEKSEPWLKKNGFEWNQTAEVWERPIAENSNVVSPNVIPSGSRSWETVTTTHRTEPPQRERPLWEIGVDLNRTPEEQARLTEAYYNK